TCPSKHFDDGGLISMTGTLHDSHRLSVKTWTEEESDRADSILSRSCTHTRTGPV
ncbi:hypothetical protein ILYODFUR_032755, partial [Ilyodon furcidens]